MTIKQIAKNWISFKILVWVTGTWALIHGFINGSEWVTLSLGLALTRTIGMNMYRFGNNVNTGGNE